MFLKYEQTPYKSTQVNAHWQKHQTGQNKQLLRRDTNINSQIKSHFIAEPLYILCHAFFIKIPISPDQMEVFLILPRSHGLSTVCGTDRSLCRQD